MIVYKLTSPSGKSYIGLTVATVKRRFSQHKTLWRKLKKQGVRDYREHRCTSLLFFAFDRYDPDLWSHEVLFESDDSDAIRTMEIAMIQEHGTLAPGGYNVLLGGQMGHAGRKLSEEHKAKQRAARLAYYESDDGKIWKDGLTEKFKGNTLSKGVIPHNKGKVGLMKHTDEAKRKISEGLTGKTRTDEHRENIRKAKIGVKHSPEHVAARAASIKGFKQSDLQKETVSKMFAKTYDITFPDGRIERITNMRQFCLAHGLNPGNMVALGKSKGFTSVKVQ